MRVVLVKISKLRFSLVQYYTVRIEGRSTAEFVDFFQRLSISENDKTELTEINRYIEQIGTQFGAKPRHFRAEDAAEGLPPSYHEFIGTQANDYGLRLYCIRLSETIVILLNGDRKTAQKVQNCVNCYKHFELARKLSQKINHAIIDGDIILDHDNMDIIMEDFTLDI